MTIHKTLLSLFSFAWSVAITAQIDPNFFPTFQAYSPEPIIRYADGFANASWNDPTILKQDGQYIMYITSASGFVLSNENTVKVYRQVSPDGYNWTLSPTTPVLEAEPKTYYAGGTETPSVVIKNGVYHMYLTCYPPGNHSDEFVIGHAVSDNGIDWTMDQQPVLESDGSETLYGELVGEPGAILFNDSIYVFFTAGGIIGGIPSQSIGLIKSADGTNFNTPEVAVTMPTSIYPVEENYWGLSTPSALAINDSIYVFTDVAQIINGNWTQVALHQFKTIGNSGVWYHDDAPIHTKADFDWTNGEYLSEIRSITPFLEDDGLLRIWYAGNRLADVSGSDTTYHVFFDSLGVMNADPDYWGIGTSEFQFSLINNLNDEPDFNASIHCFPNPANDNVYIRTAQSNQNLSISIYDVFGKIVLQKNNLNSQLNRLDVSRLEMGAYIMDIETQGHLSRKKLIISR
jgi:hypothetical protein